MEKPVSDEKSISYCGLYCGSCKRFLKKKCAGCADNVKATWCKIRNCCMENKFKSCADCKKHKEVNDCKIFNNLIGNIFGLIFNSNRKAGIDKIKKDGYKAFADEMTSTEKMTYPRK